MEYRKDVIADAVQKAEESFWSTIAEEFPEITTGDLDPMTSLHVNTAMNNAVRNWLNQNKPKSEIEEVLPIFMEVEMDIIVAIESGEEFHIKHTHFGEEDEWCMYNVNGLVFDINTFGGDVTEKGGDVNDSNPICPTREGITVNAYLLGKDEEGFATRDNSIELIVIDVKIINKKLAS